MSDRPFDLLGDLEGRKVKVRLKNRAVLEGVLVAWDKHLNTVLQDVEYVHRDEYPVEGDEKLFIRGDMVVTVNPAGEKE